MKKLLLLLMMCVFLSSCYIVRNKRDRYYMLYPGKAKLKGMYECKPFSKKPPYKTYKFKRR